MKEKIFKNKTVVIVVAALLIAGIGFSSGMAIRSATADEAEPTITLEEAKTIALENAGVSKENATFTKAEMDKDDSSDSYDIEFHTAQNEYEFEIDAKTGGILEKSYEPVAKSNGPVTNITDDGQDATDSAHNDGYIGIENAKEIALSHANITPDNATFIKAELDSDDNAKVYELEFTSGGCEYDYEIHALTGKVIECDSENMHHDD